VSIRELDAEIARLEAVLKLSTESGRARMIENEVRRLRRERERVIEILMQDPRTTPQAVMDRDF
jgi:hypothetical protein